MYIVVYICSNTWGDERLREHTYVAKLLYYAIQILSGVLHLPIIHEIN